MNQWSTGHWGIYATRRERWLGTSSDPLLWDNRQTPAMILARLDASLGPLRGQLEVREWLGPVPASAKRHQGQNRPDSLHQQKENQTGKQAPLGLEDLEEILHASFRTSSAEAAKTVLADVRRHGRRLHPLLRHVCAQHATIFDSAYTAALAAAITGLILGYHLHDAIVEDSLQQAGSSD